MLKLEHLGFSLIFNFFRRLLMLTNTLEPDWATTLGELPVTQQAVLKMMEKFDSMSNRINDAKAMLYGVGGSKEQPSTTEGVIHAMTLEVPAANELSALSKLSAVKSCS